MPGGTSVASIATRVPTVAGRERPGHRHAPGVAGIVGVELHTPDHPLTRDSSSIDHVGHVGVRGGLSRAVARVEVVQRHGEATALLQTGARRARRACRPAAATRRAPRGRRRRRRRPRARQRRPSRLGPGAARLRASGARRPRTGRRPGGAPAACWPGPAAGRRRAPGAAPRGWPRARRPAPRCGRAARSTWCSSVEDPADALDADAGRGEVGDLAQQLDVAVGVAAAAAAGAARRDQPHPLVGAQGLRVQAGQLGGDADDVDGGVGAGRAERELASFDDASKRLARSGLPAVAAR